MDPILDFYRSRAFCMSNGNHRRMAEVIKKKKKSVAEMWIRSASPYE